MTTCNCKHWSPRANGVPGGRCAIGHLGATVSYRTCERACEMYDGPEPRLINAPIPMTVGRVIQGAVGLAKAAVGADKAPDDIIAERLRVCGECPEWTGNKCRICGCLTNFKVRLASEACPLDPPKWGPHPASTESTIPSVSVTRIVPSTRSTES